MLHLCLWLSNAQVFACAYEDEKAEEKAQFDQTKLIFFSTDLCKPQQRYLRVMTMSVKIWLLTFIVFAGPDNILTSGKFVC